MNLPCVEQCLWPLSLDEADECVRLSHSVAEYLEVYRALFPQDYQRSMLQITRGLAPFWPPRGQVYAPHERHFLRCVHATQFAIADMDEFFANAEERCYTVPIHPIGVDHFYLYPGHAIRKGWLLLLYLTGDVEAETVVELFGEPFEDPVQAEACSTSIVSIPLTPDGLNEEALASACRQRQGPLAGLKTALDVVCHETGNIWLDCTSEMPADDLPWETAVILDLAQQFPAAQRMMAQARSLVAWLEDDPFPHFQEVASLWNTCA